MSDLTNLTILQIKEGFKKKKFSVLEVTKAFISASEKIKDFNVYNTFTPEKALEASKYSQLRIDNHSSIIPSNFKKGYYQLMNSEKIIGSFGLNYDRTESVAIDDQLKKLNEIENSPLLSIVEVFGNQSNNSPQLSNLKNTYWFACLIIALICLFGEMILIRIKI